VYFTLACAAERRLLKLRLSKQALQGAVVLLKLFEPIGVFRLQPAVVVSPPVVALLRYAQLAANCPDVVAVGEHPVGLAELAYDLLRGVTLPLLRHDLTSLPARCREHQDDPHNCWTEYPGPGQDRPNRWERLCIG